ncbi:MAG TPA: tetratricopeptide repeat protein [Blastocatellia bacterium]|nr:tetratricopeptide repeat protein [Blastocatellia bacterium]
MEAIGLPGKYKIIEKLGTGGMGEVYKAEDLALLRTVAIKVMSKAGERTVGGETRFLREARAASAFNHPNIVTIYEIGETDEHTYIVMEYVAGRSLRNLITTRELRHDKILDIAMQTCDALLEAHSHEIIHRDIKPENILLADRGRVKLVDFGLAKAVPTRQTSGATAAERLTESGTIMGTLSYMSPEQLRGEPLDRRSDIFSFGIVLYEMIMGELPFIGSNSFEVAASILKDPPLDIGTVPHGLPHGIKHVVAKLLAKRRDERYSSFEEVKQAIEALAGERRNPPDASGDERPTVATPPRVSDRRSAAFAAGLRSSVKKGPSAPTILVLPLQTVGSDETSSYIGIGLAHAITTDLAKIEGLAVLSKSAGAGRLDETGHGVNQLARELGATILLEGEVMRSGETIGVMARLTDAETGRVIWGSQYRGDLTDLFSIQDAVCESVAAALELNISAEVRGRMAQPATRNIDAFEFYSKGRVFLERRDIKQNIDFAIQMFHEALELDPDFSLAHAGLGEAYWRKYQTTRESVWVDRAIAASDHALVLDPHQAQVHISLGIIYHGTGKIERAMEEFERAIELQPMSDEAYQWMGRCCQRKGDMERAVGYFEKAIELRPGYWDNYNALGNFYYTFGRYRDAAEQYRRVITFQPDSSQGYSNLGAMYYLQGLYQDAVAMYRRAIDIHPNELSYANLGTAYFYLGRYDDAIEAYGAALKLNPTEDQHYWNLGDAYMRVGRIDDAQRQYARAGDLLEERLNVDPSDATCLGQLALYRAKLQRFDEALELIERATQLEPRNTTLMYKKAVVYALKGDCGRATEYLALALENGYSRAEAQRDPDLEGLRTEPAYAELFALHPRENAD